MYCGVPCSENQYIGVSYYFCSVSMFYRYNEDRNRETDNLVIGGYRIVIVWQYRPSSNKVYRVS
jgi:hypothetical protein